jgi:hypothetical protein
MSKFDFSKCTFNEDNKSDPLLVVWLVWVWMPARHGRRDYFTLRSVSLTERHAEYAKRTAQSDINGCKVYIERTIAEHLFAENMFNHISGFDLPPEA